MRRLFSLAALLVCLSLPAQIMVEEIGAISDQIEKAGEHFRNYRFEKAAEALGGVIATFEQREKQGRLQEPDEALYKKALELRAVSLFHVGKEQSSREDLVSLVRLDPNYGIEVTSSTKILRFYGTVRDSVAGSIALKVSPPEASVLVDGRPASVPESGAVYLVEGVHTVRVELAGYDPVTKEVTVAAGTSLQETVELRPNARKVVFFLKPKGAKLFIDGRFAGSADLKASQKPEWAQYVSGAGFDPEACFVVESLYLPPGNRSIEVVAPCHGTRKFSLPVSLDPQSNKPGFIKPIELQRETLTLTVTSRPAGAEVEIDGTKHGKTPLVLREFCSGGHSFRIFKQDQGEFRQKLEFSGTSSFELDARLRPTLLWAGLTSDQEVPPEATGSFASSMRSALAALPSFNVAFSEETNPLLPDTFYTRGVTEAEKEKVVGELCSRYGSEGVLVGKLYTEGEKVHVSLRLFVPGIPGFDETTSLMIETGDASFLLKKFDREEEDLSPGFTGVREGASKALIVLGADSCPSVLRPGDRITGAKVKGRGGERDLSEGGPGEGEELTLSVRRGPQELSLRTVKGPRVVVHPGAGSKLRRALLLSRQAVLSAENEQDRAVADFNLACAELGLGRNDEALDVLEAIKTEAALECLSASRDYLRAVAFAGTGRIEEARSILVALKGSAGGQYLGNDGKILLEPLVEDLLDQLEGKKRG